MKNGEELANKDRLLRAELKERGKDFINEQLKKDQELLKILEVREKKKSRIYYKRLMPLATCTRSIKKRSKPQFRRGMSKWKPLNYREKLWIDSLDMCNSNMKNLYNAQGEFEGALNSIRGRQNELIKVNAKMLEWFTNKLAGYKTTEQP